MKLRDSIDKTKLLLHNTIQNLKSLFLCGYQKLPKPSSSNPLSHIDCSLINHQTGHCYTEIFYEWECDLENAIKRSKSGSIVAKESARETEDGCNASCIKLPRSPLRKKEVTKEEKNKKSSNSRKGGQQFSKNKDAGYPLAKKLKELEMMDASDVEHVLDVEEALHYYNRLKSPVYLDIVDQFFTHIYREFSVPQASATTNSSKRRRSSVRL